MRYDYYEDPVVRGSTVGTGEEIGGILGTAIQGFADWIGLGSKIGTWMKKAGGFDRDKAVSDINNKIAQLRATDDARLQSLQEKLDRLATSGFSLNGIASEALAKYQKRVRSDRDSAERHKRDNELEYSKMEQDVERAADMSDKLDPQASRVSKDILKTAREKLGIG